MSERPRVGAVVYGSVLNPTDLRELFDDISGRIRPVTVSGFQRIFDQEASWRETDGRHRAVLNVEQHPDRWFNGILIADISRSEFREFRERERGYRLVEVESDEIAPYESAEIAAGDTETMSTDEMESQDLVVTTVGGKQNDDILPVDDYVDICRAGAQRWGEQFLQDFMSTTRVNTGETLAEYVEDF